LALSFQKASHYRSKQNAFGLFGGEIRRLSRQGMLIAFFSSSFFFLLLLVLTVTLSVLHQSAGGKTLT
jgi:hypothetical protein